jgi:hypothetical protein
MYIMLNSKIGLIRQSDELSVMEIGIRIFCSICF